MMSKGSLIGMSLVYMLFMILSMFFGASNEYLMGYFISLIAMLLGVCIGNFLE